MSRTRIAARGAACLGRWAVCRVGLLLGVSLAARGQSGTPIRGNSLQAAQSAPATISFPHESPRHLGAAIGRLVAEPKVARAHWGVAVAAMDGTPVYGMDEGQFFQPASNAKLFTSAAAMAMLGAERTVETRVVGRGTFSANAATLKGDLLLVGAGDANLSGREVPYLPPLPPGSGSTPKSAQAPEPDPLRYLDVMATQVAASGLKVIDGDVVGDDTVWPWEPYPQDWAIDDAVWGYGAPVSALSIADNELRLTITPAAVAGLPATVRLEQATPFYMLEANVVTAAAKNTAGTVQVNRVPGARVLRVYGQIAADAAADDEQVAIEDPAEYAAAALKQFLEQHGVRVQGRVRAAHALPTETRGLQAIARDPLVPRPAEGATDANAPGAATATTLADENRTLASRVSAPLAQDVVVTNKLSQNLHAELMLRQLGAAFGDGGTAAQGARVVRSFLVGAGVDPEDFVFYDGSGLSGHDLVTPRATVRLLTWASGQPWFAAWKASLPVGGVDGSLVARFAKGPLKGKVFAKTGTLGEARALSGYVVCKSGRTVAFAVMVTDHAPGGVEDREVMDRIVEVIAALN